MKNRLYKRYVALLLGIVLLISFIQVPTQVSAAEDPLNINASAAIIVEPTTGKVLYEKNADTALGIASMTKMMTEYLLFEAIEEKKITWEQEQVISEYAHKVSVDTSLSNVPLNEGKSYTIRELYEAMAIFSANGATIAIAEAIAGTESKFVELMNAKAEELGLDDYNFVNSTGLNNKDLKGMHPEGTDLDIESTMSARSTAKLAVRLLEDYPQVLETTSIPKKKFPDTGGDMVNWNKMLPTLEHKYEGVDGLKTGTTDFAGSCFTGTATQGDMRVVTVVMNAPSDQARFNETRKMLNYAFDNFSMVEVLPAQYKVKGYKSLPVVKGKEKSVNLQTEEPVKVVVQKGQEEAYKPVFTINDKKLNKQGELTAPIKKGEQVGTITMTNEGGQDYGYIGKEYEPKIKVVTTKEVEKANWFVLSMRGIGGFFSDLWSTITDTVKGWF